MPFPIASEALEDEVAPGAEERAGHALSLEAVEQRLIVRHDDGVQGESEVKEGVVRGAVPFHHPKLGRKPLGALRIPIVRREQPQFLEDGRG